MLLSVILVAWIVSRNSKRRKVHQVVPMLLAAVSGFWAATIPTQKNRITTITATITIPVQAVIMEDLAVADIMVAVLMVVVADTANVNA